MRRARLLACITLIVIALPLFAQPPELQFDISIDGWPETALIRRACLAPDGILVAASNSIGGGQSDLLLAKLTFNGDLLWTREYGEDADNPYATVRSLAEMPDGGCVLAGGVEQFGLKPLMFFDMWGDSLTQFDLEFNPCAVAARSNGYMVAGNHTEIGLYGEYQISDFARLGQAGAEAWRYASPPGMSAGVIGTAVIPVEQGEFCLVKAGAVDLPGYEQAIEIWRVNGNGQLQTSYDLNLPEWPDQAIHVKTIRLREGGLATAYTVYTLQDSLYSRIDLDNPEGEMVQTFDLDNRRLFSMLETRSSGLLLLAAPGIINGTLDVIACDLAGSISGTHTLAESYIRAYLLSSPNGGSIVVYQTEHDETTVTRFARFLPPEVPYSATITNPAQLIELPSSGGEVLVDLQASHALSMADDVHVELEVAMWGGAPDSVAGWTETIEPGQIFTRTDVPVDFAASGREGFYRITVRASNGLGTIFAEDHVFVQKGPITSVPDPASQNSTLPGTMALTAFPNPFNGIVELRLNLPADGAVRVDILNILGQRVATLADDTRRAGTQTLVWDAASATSGVYLVRAQAESGANMIRKVVLLK